MAEAMLNMPCSEAEIERAFSRLHHLLKDRSSHTKTDLLEARVLLGTHNKDSIPDDIWQRAGGPEGEEQTDGLDSQETPADSDSDAEPVSRMPVAANASSMVPSSPFPAAVLPGSPFAGSRTPAFSPTSPMSHAASRPAPSKGVVNPQGSVSLGQVFCRRFSSIPTNRIRMFLMAQEEFHPGFTPAGLVAS
jgi:hypothetical protein